MLFMVSMVSVVSMETYYIYHRVYGGFCVDTVDVYQDVGAVSGKDLTHSALGDVIKVVK